LEKKPTHTLGKNARLKSRKVIDALFTNGKSFSLFPFKVIYAKEAEKNSEETACQTSNINLPARQESHQLKCAFSVSKKHFKKAVHRNRIKRLMREAYRLQKNDLQSQVHQSNKNLSVFILYVNKELPDHALMVSKMNAVLIKLQKIVNEMCDV
jgi:ribonuclease P protein component